MRRDRLAEKGVAGARIMGPAGCRETTEAREFLYRNFVPFAWTDTTTEDGKRRVEAAAGPRPRTPVIDCGNGRVLRHPNLHELADAVGIWQGCPTETFDLAVVGCGPAGMSAAVYAASEGLKVCVLDRLGPGGQAAGSSRIENFIGFPSGLTGTDLATRAVLQMFKFGSHLSVPMEVLSLEPAKTDDDPHLLHLNCGASLRAQTVLAATGVKWRTLDVPGAKRFERAGVYYACNPGRGRGAPGHRRVRGRRRQLGRAGGHVPLGALREHRPRPRPWQEPVDLHERVPVRPPAEHANVQVHTDTCVAEVFGDRRITGVDVTPKGGGERTHIDCSAVFVFVGSDPHVDWLHEHVATDAKGYILTGSDLERAGKWPLQNRSPCPLETSLPRVMAAGDVRAGSTKRVGFAVGDGSLACTCTHTLRTLRA